MYEGEENQCSVLFRIYEGGDLYSIPIQWVTWVEPLEGKPTAVLRSPDHIVGVYPRNGKNISIVDLGCLLGLERTLDSKSANHSLLIIENTEVGFLVESVLGVETLHSRQSPDPLSKQIIGGFMFELSERGDAINEFDERLWLAVVEKATAYHDGRLVFRFQNGSEIES